MRRRSKFGIALTVGLVGAAVAATTVYAVTRGGGGTGAGPSVPSLAPLKPTQAKSTGFANGCKTGLTDFVNVDAYGQTTTSTSYVPVPGMSLIVKSKTGCMFVTVSADGYNNTGGLEYVTVAVDGFTGFPDQVQWAGDSNTWAEAHSATFAFPVSKGFHTVQMFFLSTFGDSSYLGYPVMTVTHS